MMVSFPSKISLVLFLFLCATTFNISNCSNNKQVIRCNEKDQWILSTFKAGVVDPSNFLSSWSSEEHCCSWIGVHCDNLTGRITMLDLHSYPDEPMIGGEINLISLLQLEFLNYLDLSFNNFTSISIPSFLLSKSPTNISINLQYLDFSTHDSFGIDNLNWLSPLSSLKYLNLNGIDLSNEPNWLHSVAMLPSLSELRLSSCGLTNISPSLNYVDNFSSSLVTLDLSGNNIKSELPNWLFNLTSAISSLHLSDNYFYGQIPISLLRLRNLHSLNLWYNQLSGSIPYWLGQLEHLQNLDFSGNLLSGSIPSTLANLSSVTSLDLSYNHLLSGSIPSTLANLSSLTSLDFSYNHLSGYLPRSLGQLHNLESFNVGGNSLVGILSEEDPNWVPPFQLRELRLRNVSLGPNFPAWLYTLKSLEYLDISSSGISSIDDEDMFWSFMAKIGDVDISHNSISGDISEVTLNSSSIDLSYNDFTGELPHISSNVFRLTASHNSFSGSISPLLCHRMSNGENSFDYLDISNNLLTGELPDCWANWKQLSHLDLGNNNLTGQLPPSMVTLSNLYFLDLHNNSFFGEFSLNLSSFSDLNYLSLAENKFSGSLPITLQQSLVMIQLRSNQFTGSIPPYICNLTSLEILDLADNMLFGSIPQCIYNMTAMVSGLIVSHFGTINIITKGREAEYLEVGMLYSIDLSSNYFVGEIPHELFSLTQLWSLNLSRNNLSGKIPKEIGGMKNLECLDLSHNKLSGEIPQSISNLSFLSYLNLSYNNFIGQIPLGTQIQSFETWSFIGNPELCGVPLKNCTEPEKQKQKQLEEGDDDDIFLKSLYLGMGVGFAVGFWVVCGSIFCIRAWRHRFFLWFDGVVDRVYVAMALEFKSFS